jgi:hypothetical protein
MKAQSAIELKITMGLRAVYGIFGRQETVVEGDSLTAISRDGQASHGSLGEVTAAIRVSREEVPDITFGQVLNRVDEAIKDMQRKASERLAEMMFGMAQQAGIASDLVSQSLTAERLLDVVEKMEVSFRSNGMPNAAVVIAPETRDAVEKEMARLQTNPGLRDRFDKLMAQKRAEWVEREAARRLVG